MYNNIISQEHIPTGYCICKHARKMYTHEVFSIFFKMFRFCFLFCFVFPFSRCVIMKVSRHCNRNFVFLVYTGGTKVTKSATARKESLFTCAVKIENCICKQRHSGGKLQCLFVVISTEKAPTISSNHKIKELKHFISSQECIDDLSICMCEMQGPYSGLYTLKKCPGHA